jgi:hypothetical protein
MWKIITKLVPTKTSNLTGIDKIDGRKIIARMEFAFSIKTYYIFIVK